MLAQRYIVLTGRKVVSTHPTILCKGLTAVVVNFNILYFAIIIPYIVFNLIIHQIVGEMLGAYVESFRAVARMALITGKSQYTAV